MDLPTVLYRCPGPHSRAGGTYDFLGVETEENYEAAIAAGWKLTMPDAIDAYEGKVKEIKAEVEKELDAEDRAKEPAPEAPAPQAPAKVAPDPKPKAKPGPKPKAK